jgi:hypothetical protein
MSNNEFMNISNERDRWRAMAVNACSRQTPHDDDDGDGGSDGGGGSGGDLYTA